MAATEDAPMTFMSPNTNRLVPIGTDVNAVPVFWCEICRIELRNATTAVTHFRGRPHAKLKLLNETKDSVNMKCELCSLQLDTVMNAEEHFKGKKHASRKRAFDAGNGNMKDEQLKCEDCKLEFNNNTVAAQHFKGKKHAAVLRKNAEVKEPKKVKNDTVQSGVRGRGRRFRSGNRYININTGPYNSVQPPFKPLINTGLKLSEYFVKGGETKLNTNNGNSSLFNKVTYNSPNLPNNSSGETRTQPSQHNDKHNAQQRNELITTQCNNHPTYSSINRSEYHSQYHTNDSSSVVHKIYERTHETNIQLLPNKISNHSGNNNYNQGNSSNQSNSNVTQCIGNSNNYVQGNRNSSNNSSQGIGNSNTYSQGNHNSSNSYSQGNHNFTNNYGKGNDNSTSSYSQGGGNSNNYRQAIGNSNNHSQGSGSSSNNYSQGSGNSTNYSQGSGNSINYSQGSGNSNNSNNYCTDSGNSSNNYSQGIGNLSNNYSQCIGNSSNNYSQGNGNSNNYSQGNVNSNNYPIDSGNSFNNYSQGSGNSKNNSQSNIGFPNNGSQNNTTTSNNYGQGFISSAFSNMYNNVSAKYEPYQ